MKGKKTLTIDKKAIVIDNAELTPGSPCHMIALRGKTPLKQDNENMPGYINKSKEKLPLSFFKGVHTLSTEWEKVPLWPIYSKITCLSEPSSKSASMSCPRQDTGLHGHRLDFRCVFFTCALPSLPPHPGASPSQWLPRG